MDRKEEGKFAFVDARCNAALLLKDDGHHMVTIDRRPWGKGKLHQSPRGGTNNRLYADERVSVS